MATITREILESYIHCRYKGHLKLIGERGIASDYEILMNDTRKQVHRAAVDKFCARNAEGEALADTTITYSVLTRGIPLIFSSILVNRGISVQFDALQRVSEASRLGDFSYLPVVISEVEHVSKSQRSLLELYGLLLTPLQGVQTEMGIIIHGQNCKVSRIKLPLHDGRTRRLLQDMKHINSAAKPDFVLNHHCEICEFRQRCYRKALAKDDLSLLRGMSEKEITTYKKKGIFTVAQLSYCFRPRTRRKQAQQKPPRHQAALKALAIREKRIHVYGAPELPRASTRIYIDLEGDPDRRFVYLIGVIVHGGRTHSEEKYSFWANTPAEESSIYHRLLDVTKRHQDVRLYSYGSYETAFLRRMLNNAGQPQITERLLAGLVNVLSTVYSHVYFPTYSNGLKDVGKYLGCKWAEPDASGIQSIVWRRKWEMTGSPALKETLISYNMEDCAALERVTEFLFGLCRCETSRIQDRAVCHQGHQVSRLEDIDPLWNRREWGAADFVVPDFKVINDCAYFDYQQDKVYVRTSKSLKRTQAVRVKNKGKRNLKPNRNVEINSDSCRFCREKELVRQQDGRLARVGYDLRVGRNGIKRAITRFTTKWHWCGQCKKRFLPPEYLNLDEYGHSLKSWAMYEHIAHRASLSNIADKFDQYFGLPLHAPDISSFKHLLSMYYAETYDQILRKIVSGNLIHADETEVQVRQVGKAYVWIFTNLEEVVFMYRESREGDFLRDMLKDFRGVLVSDFYAPYNGLKCEQQKCLIHLIRDFNHDIRSNAWDEELKSLASEFGGLLRLIVATVDQYGLKQRHLNKHRRDVDRFYRRSVSNRVYRSEVAERYQKRFLSYQNKLFTFLCHDGVPWNNNNAEHAVKRFAYYREVADGELTAAGLKRYLALLSLYVTCKYKKLNFLQFLLSREKDIDVFRPHSGRQTAQPPIELIPNGFRNTRGSRRRDWDDMPQRPYGAKRHDDEEPHFGG